MKELIAMIESSPKFNGHNQIEINVITNKRLLKLFKKLSERMDKQYYLDLRYYFDENLNKFNSSIYKIDPLDNEEFIYCSFETVLKVPGHKKGKK